MRRFIKGPIQILAFASAAEGEDLHPAKEDGPLGPASFFSLIGSSTSSFTRYKNLSLISSEWGWLGDSLCGAQTP